MIVGLTAFCVGTYMPSVASLYLWNYIYEFNCYRICALSCYKWAVNIIVTFVIHYQYGSIYMVNVPGLFKRPL